MVAPYGPDGIQVLEGLEPVRRRPAMYFGDVGATGMHRLLWEVLGNALDEMVRVGGGRIDVTIDGDRVTVEDAGAGIPVDAIADGDATRPALELVMTRLHAGGGRFSRRSHRLHGVGVAAVNAVCDEMHVEVWRDGVHHEQRYARGVPLGPVTALGKATRTGTRVSLVPDRTIFVDAAWDRGLVDARCREIAALTPSVAIGVDGTTHHYADGLARYLEELAGVPLVDPLAVTATEDGVEIDLALAFVPGRGAVHAFVDYDRVPKGTHVDGLRGGVRRAVAKRVPTVARSRTGTANLLGVIHVRLDEATYGRVARTQLLNPEVAVVIATLVERGLLAHFERGPMLDALLI